MKRYGWLRAIVIFFAMFALASCGEKTTMENVNSGIQPQAEIGKTDETISDSSIIVRPDRSLGIEPTQSIREGKTANYELFFPKRLYFGEYLLGRIRWNTWTVSLTDKRESFGQAVYYGVHKSELRYFGTNLIDDAQIESGATAILSSKADYIYSPFDKELAVERERFLNEPAYRREKIIEVNTLKDGTIFNIRALAKVPDFKWYVKNWNQLKTPDGYLLTPYGKEEVAKIRGINPQYSYFEKLVGTGKFAVVPTGDVVSFAMANSIGILMDMIGAINAPSRGADYDSLITRREMAYIGEYAQRLMEKAVTDLKNKNTGDEYARR